MKSEDRKSAIAALLIIVIFGLGFYFMPRIMLALGEWSTLAAGLVAIAFVGAFFAVFWLRARSRGDGS